MINMGTTNAFIIINMFITTFIFIIMLLRRHVDLILTLAEMDPG